MDQRTRIDDSAIKQGPLPLATQLAAGLPAAPPRGDGVSPVVPYHTQYILLAWRDPDGVFHWGADGDLCFHSYASHQLELLTQPPTGTR